VTQLLQRLRDELVRRDYAAPTIRSYTQIVEAFRRHTGARLDRITPAQLRRYHLSCADPVSDRRARRPCRSVRRLRASGDLL
jgi:hypothetical protein